MRFKELFENANPFAGKNDNLSKGLSELKKLWDRYIDKYTAHKLFSWLGEFSN